MTDVSCLWNELAEERPLSDTASPISDRAQCSMLIVKKPGKSCGEGADTKANFCP